MKKVVLYGNCQTGEVRRILATHPILNQQYDFHNAISIGNFVVIKEQRELPYADIEAADLFIYQPTADKHGVYSTREILKHLKPDCKTISFPYIYNYAFWEVLVFADGDYAVGHSGTQYAHLNHKPITRLKEKGMSYPEIEHLIRTNQLDWDFEERYRMTQTILREKEAICDIKVADFIDTHHKDRLLFYTQNHITTFFLKYLADEMVRLLGEDPSLFPHSLPEPSYGTYVMPIGQSAWNHYKFKFMPQPGDATMYFILSYAEKIYKGEFVNT